jgi:hypothetical protein
MTNRQLSNRLPWYDGRMAREESEREDLLREATALVERIELQITSSTGGEDAESVPIVIGFRSNGAISIFFGGDPVYQFNAAGALRRAYCDGALFKATHGKLISLERVRRPDEVQLLSRELTNGEEAAFMFRMQDRLRALAISLERGSFRINGQVPTGADVLHRVKQWLAAHDGMPIAKTPRA